MLRYSLKYVKSVATALLAAMLVMAAQTGCKNPVFDYEGDCSVSYNIKFRYDKNLKWADAFASEVKSVRLYAFDTNGVLCKVFTDRGDALANPDYRMKIELPAGDYHLVAWCGIDNESLEQPQFDVPTATPGSTILDELTCRLRRQPDAPFAAASKQRLEFMFHGQLDVQLPEDEDGGDFTYVMPLTKDTNHVRIILQQLSGEDADADDFDFRIEDKNGFYAHDNSLLDDETITYRPYKTMTGTAGVGKQSATRTIIYVNGAIADLSVARLMADRNRDMILTITNKHGDTVASFPLIDYALLAKDYYEEAYGRKMDDQEFLDREDEYVMTLFLDETQRWIDTSILIHSWRVVVHDYEA